MNIQALDRYYAYKERREARGLPANKTEVELFMSAFRVAKLEHDENMERSYKARVSKIFQSFTAGDYQNPITRSSIIGSLATLVTRKI